MAEKMLTGSVCNQPAATQADETSAQLVRQPIFDAAGHLYAYELFLHPGGAPSAVEAEAENLPVVFDRILVHGLEKLCAGMPALIRASEQGFAEALLALLPPEETILGITDPMASQPSMPQEVRRLRQMGYKLALCSWQTADPLPTLLPLFDYLKLPVDASEADRWKLLQKQADEAEVALVAEAIDAQESFRVAREFGCKYFQGFYFCHPDPVPKSSLAGNKLMHVQLLQLLRTDPLDLKKIAPLVRRDAGLLYRLLKLVNSPLCAIRQEVTSIELAILALGENTFRRMAMLAVLGEINDGQPAELIHMTLIRARFCEIASKSNGLDAEEQYLLGIFSLLPAMLRRPIEELAAELPLRKEIREALLGHEVAERALLCWIEAHEHNEALRKNAIASRFGLNSQRLEQFYVDALLWESVAAASFR